MASILSHNIHIGAMHGSICDLHIHEKDEKVFLDSSVVLKGLYVLKMVLIPSQLDGI